MKIYEMKNAGGIVQWLSEAERAYHLKFSPGWVDVSEKEVEAADHVSPVPEEVTQVPEAPAEAEPVIEDVPAEETPAEKPKRKAKKED